MDIDFIFLSPFDQAAFVVGVDRHQIFDIEEIGKDKLLDKPFGINESLIQKHRPDKSFEYISVNMFIPGDIRFCDDSFIRPILMANSFKDSRLTTLERTRVRKPSSFLGKNLYNNSATIAPRTASPKNSRRS